ncbi:NAD(P)H-binding protein [Streptomyces sp. NPDC002265]|uniref:SDR family oxidoreductase n=1 Tax=Streptomyces sp. NPDC002265 TaxID=3154415 RepID=UPI00332D7FF3
MKVVVAGATGRIGSRSVTRLREHGAQVVPLSRALGVNVGDAHALRRALRGAQILVDITDAPSRQQDVSTAFFGDTTRSLLMAARETGVEHYVALSAVGADRVASGYLRAKAAQEDLVRRSALPYSLVPAAAAGRDGDVAAPSPTSPSRCRCSASWRPPDPRSDRSRTSPPTCSPPRTA